MIVAVSLDDENLEWVEEPVAHDDLVGCARVAAALDTPVQAGENFSGPSTLASAIELSAQDYVMIDLMRIGGVSGWLQTSKLAEKAGLPLSSHLYPEVSVAPSTRVNAHCTLVGVCRLGGTVSRDRDFRGGRAGERSRGCRYGRSLG